MNFSPREFRSALGVFPTGVSIVTARAISGRHIGITVNSFVSVSLDPPLISFNLAKSLESFRELVEVETFAVNILTEAQSKVSQGFACAGTDKWSCVTSSVGPTANPIIEPNLAVFECSKYAQYEAGDHLIVVGRVLRFAVNENEAPLVFFRGAYRAVGELIEDRS